MVPTPPSLEAASTALAGGDLDQAADVCRQVLDGDPQQAEAWHLLALTHLLRGDVVQGEEMLRRAVELCPDNGVMAMNLGRALNEQGRWAEALPVLRRALELLPEQPEALNNLGNALQKLGDPEAAITAYQRALELQLGRDDIRRNLAAALLAAGRAEAVAALLQNVLDRAPADVDAALDLARTLAVQRRLGETEVILRQVLHRSPNHPRAAFALGVTLSDQARWVEAEEVFHAIIRHDPSHAEAYQSRGVMLRYLGRLTEGMICQQQAIALRPEYPQSWLSLGAVLAECGRIDDALETYRRSLSLAPDPAVQGNLCFALLFSATSTREQIAAEHHAWDRQYGTVPRCRHDNHDSEPARRLRLGFVSADFREHSVAYFFEPVLAARDHAAFEVFCYAEGFVGDAITTRLRSLADHWRDIWGQDTETVVNRIQADRIDILIDLSGHTMQNRLPVFARKPAPVQITWLGYPETTGLAAIDYKVTDHIVCPEDEAFAAEAPLRLPYGFHSYRAPTEAPMVAPPPCLAKGFVTFGAFHGPCRIGPPVVAAWAAILQRVPGSRLCLKAQAFCDTVIRDRYLSMFAVVGIAAERLILLPRTPSTAAHLAQYHDIDIALDPFPYNGTTTTCEALWMGVPVLTLRGDRPAARMSASLLHQLDLRDLVARDVADYVDKACALAQDATLAELRASLRDRFAASRLGNAETFTRDLERGLTQAWRQWCEDHDEPAGLF